jgi:uncharacterized protein with von Willebrand factor type A (vWA) domain
MARPRNPRRLALEVIDAIRSNAQTMKARWSWVPSTTWRQDENGRFIHETRARKDIPASEYRENNPEEWAQLALFMDTIAEQATNVAAYARKQEAEARKRLGPSELQKWADRGNA